MDLLLLTCGLILLLPPSPTFSHLSWKPLFKMITAETHSSKATHTIGHKLHI